jgi:phosphoribosylformylglycinamidine (FGAM) synthase-like enzyme
MFGIPLPWLILGVTIALFGSYRGGYHFGWSDRDAEMQIEIARKNEESRKTEQKLTEQLNTTASKLLETTNVVNQKQTALDSAIRAGRVRIPTASCVQAPTSTASATTDTKAGSEPDRQTNEASDAERATLLAIAEIVAQGDRNTAALNACIDSYNEVRNLLNGK